MAIILTQSETRVEESASHDGAFPKCDHPRKSIVTLGMLSWCGHPKTVHESWSCAQIRERVPFKVHHSTSFKCRLPVEGSSRVLLQKSKYVVCYTSTLSSAKTPGIATIIYLLFLSLKDTNYKTVGVLG